MRTSRQRGHAQRAPACMQAWWWRLRMGASDGAAEGRQAGAASGHECARIAGQCAATAALWPQQCKLLVARGACLCVVALRGCKCRRRRVYLCANADWPRATPSAPGARCGCPPPWPWWLRLGYLIRVDNCASPSGTQTRPPWPHTQGAGTLGSPRLPACLPGAAQ